MTSATNFGSGSGQTPALGHRVRAALRAIWFVVVPALLAIVAVRFLVPRSGPGVEGLLGLVARVGRDSPLVLGSALFAMFSLLARYWLVRLTNGPAVARVEKPWREVARVAAVLALAVGAALLVRAKLAEPYRVLTASMLPTLEPGDQVLVNKRAYRSEAPMPARGDVVAFRSDAVALSEPAVPPVLMKRVIGLPGDRVQMRGGLPVINGWQVPTCDVGEYVYLLPDGQGGAATGRLVVEFLDDRAYLTVQTVAKPFPHSYEVKPGEVFVLGDNRGNSIDSRSYRGALGAGVPLAALDGRVERYLVGSHLDGRTDWHRALQPVVSGSPRLHVEGFDVRPLEDGIARCLRDAPKVTRSPPPQGAFTPAAPLLQGGGV